MMKFEDILMQKSLEHSQRRLDLESQVVELEEVLEKEENLNKVLQCAMHGPLLCTSCASSPFSLQVEALLSEIEMVEEEIIYLEKRVEALKLLLYQDREDVNQIKWDLQQQWKHHQHMKFLRDLKGQNDIRRSPLKSRTPSWIDGRHDFLQKASDTSSILSTHTVSVQGDNGETSNIVTPNKLSEELVKVMIGIFQKMHSLKQPEDSEDEGLAKTDLSCMSSRSLITRSSCSTKSSNCSSSTAHTHIQDPYHVLMLEGEKTVRDIEAYKMFTSFTRSSFFSGQIGLYNPAIRRLRKFMHELRSVELSFLTYKQKLAFWINTYNACIMHAFLKYGLPPSPDKLLELLNKARANVGGIVLNALAIEHFILRPSHIQQENSEEKEMLLHHAYGLEYPEPNITFALCRGSWSSPALRVYSAENIMDELEKAKVEYLEASIGITSKKKINIPKLLQWHMHDFADDIESLIEWTYSQLPRNGALKRSIMECLRGDIKMPLAKMVQIQPYQAEFRYLLT